MIERELVGVRICGIATRVPKSWYDWVDWLATACRNRWRTRDGYSYGGYEGDHSLDCVCGRCQNWRHADALLAKHRAEEGRL